MSSLLSGVTTVISSYVSWLSDLTSYLISNTIVQLLFAMIIIFKIIVLIIKIIKVQKYLRS